MEMKVGAQKATGFYIRAAVGFVKGIDAKPAAAGEFAQAPKRPIDELVISGVGEAIHSAGAVAAHLESTGLAEVAKVETGYPEMPGSGRPCAQLAVTVRRLKKAPAEKGDLVADRAYEYTNRGKVQSGRVDVGGRSIHYLSMGASSSKPIVLLHGDAFDTWTWQVTGIFEALVEAGYLVLAPDYPGTGVDVELNPSGSAMLPEEENKTFLASFLAGVGVKTSAKVLIVAASGGGRLAVPFLSASPARAAGYISVASDVSTYPDGSPTFQVPAVSIFGTKDRRMAEWSVLFDKKFARISQVRYEGAPHPAHLLDADTAAKFVKLVLTFAAEKLEGELVYAASWS